METPEVTNRESPVVNDEYVGDQMPPATYVGKSSTTKHATTASELLRADAGDVQATSVSFDRSGAEQVTADRVSMERSGAKSLQAKSAQLTESGVVTLSSDQAVLQGSSAVVITANKVRMVKSKAVVLIAGDISAEGDVRSVVHIGPVAGNARTLLDPVGAVIAGAVFGAVTILGNRLMKRLTDD